jgi:hypothetical protein
MDQGHGTGESGDCVQREVTEFLGAFYRIGWPGGRWSGGELVSQRRRWILNTTVLQGGDGERTERQFRFRGEEGTGRWTRHGGAWCRRRRPRPSRAGRRTKGLRGWS